MKIFIIFGQRKERYAGEYAPEALDVIDEYGNDENAGEWLVRKVAEHRATQEFESVEAITIEVSSKDIMSRLRPDTKPLLGKV